MHIANGGVDHRKLLNRWSKQATGDHAGPVAYKALCALQAAEENAACTEAYDTDAYWHLAHNSISFTNDFVYDKRVRNWFARRGYQW